jgi:hypothetical protein
MNSKIVGELRTTGRAGAGGWSGPSPRWVTARVVAEEVGSPGGSRLRLAHSLTCLVLIALCVVPSAEAAPPAYAYRGAGRYQGLSYVVDITYERLVAMRAWQPGDPSEPIPPSRAWSLAREAVRTLIPEIDGFETVGVVLQGIGKSDRRRFVYIVSFLAPATGALEESADGIITPDQIRVWVSVDGKVFLPRVGDDKFLLEPSVATSTGGSGRQPKGRSVSPASSNPEGSR